MRETSETRDGTTHVTVYDDDGQIIERRAYSTVMIPPHPRPSTSWRMHSNRHERRASRHRRHA